ncbi:MULTISPECIES: nucleotidyltransferase domain-containing protein [unclassified Nocardioides]|uniref:nucleotidyltransferase domain-containing protein n=1 Tax=unclassified Nocardioides TaxID=2615069 RepID=UPI0006FE59F7|nr:MULTISPECIES: nucleotidyltransferase domain-containing protein [unclassified Nocardioides]KRA27995.1 DNA polymerase III subunit beta [Nocardioides sp. Root614]KRA85970.1 DNA polymerase III subunit beta [Nocardioides sp. Root682]
MNFGEPFGGVVPGARGAVLSVLLRTGKPLTGRAIHALVAERHSLGSVQQALKDLASLGIISSETVGRAGVHRINERHETVAPLRQLASPIDMLTRVLRDAGPGVDAVILFGSVARGDAHAGSDIDLAVIAPDDWAGRADLQEQVHARLGNNCDVLHLTPEQFTRAPDDREPVVAEILRDGLTLLGTVPRRSRRAS